MSSTNKAFQRFCNKYMVAGDKITFKSEAERKTYQATANNEGTVTIQDVTA